MLKLSAIVLCSLLSFLHPFFVSVIDMKHNAKDKNVEISVRVFIDDLETVLKKNYNSTTDISTSTKDAAVNSFIAKYIQAKLQLTINGKQQTTKYIGYEIQKESAWIYVEVNDVATINSLSVKCNLLYDYQAKQSNIFNIKANGVEKNYKLDFPNETVAFRW